MSACWWCHWGWPKQIRDVYDEALDKLKKLGRRDDGPLYYGPAHVVWADEDWSMAQWCLDHFDESLRYRAAYPFSDDEFAIVRESLEKLIAVPDEFKNEPEGYDDEHPENFPPPSHWEMKK